MKFIKISTVLVLSFILATAVFINVSAFPEYEPGKRTIKNLLEAAMQPVGSTMYTWGGGWNIEDTGSGKGSTCIGVLPEWKRFFEQQDSSYVYSTSKSPVTGGFEHIYEGLDCSGFIGWAVYNVFNTEPGKEGYVIDAGKMALDFSQRGWGVFIPQEEVTEYKPGDIMSSTSDSHVWMSIGRCSDGSVVLVHSSPNGVQINGTSTLDGKLHSEAIMLAIHYMSKYYPEWYAKYPKCDRDSTYLTNYEQMHWNVTGQSSCQMTDPDKYMNMSPEEILKDLFENSTIPKKVEMCDNSKIVTGDNTPFLMFILCLVGFIKVIIILLVLNRKNKIKN